MRTVNYNNNGGTFYYYDSVSEMANIEVPACNQSQYKSSCTGHRGKDWLGVDNFDEVKRLVEKDGWSEGVDKGQMLMDKIVVPKLPSVRRKKCFGSTGQAINFNRLYGGHADKCWQTTKKEITKNKKGKRGNVNILIDLSANSGMGSEQFFWKGALGTLLARAIQKSGRSVRVLGAFSVSGFLRGGAGSYSGHKNLTSVLNIKDYGQPVELNQMFAITALSGCARYYFFKSMLSCEHEINGHLGSPSPLVTEYFEPILDNNPTIIIEDVWSEKTALARAERILDEL